MAAARETGRTGANARRAFRARSVAQVGEEGDRAVHVGTRDAQLGRKGVDGLGRQPCLSGLEAPQSVKHLRAGSAQPPL